MIRRAPSRRPTHCSAACPGCCAPICVTKARLNSRCECRPRAFGGRWLTAACSTSTMHTSAGKLPRAVALRLCARQLPVCVHGRFTSPSASPGGNAEAFHGIQALLPPVPTSLCTAHHRLVLHVIRGALLQPHRTARFEFFGEITRCAAPVAALLTSFAGAQSTAS